MDKDHCQVVAHREFPCKTEESHGLQCERLDEHEPITGCWISDHTVDHSILGNGYACSSVAKGEEKYMVPELQTVTICGSMRFFSHMIKAATAETVLGNIVLCPFSTSKENSIKAMLDYVHIQKINMADRIAWVTNDKHYMGHSTRAELEYALARQIPVSVYEFSDHDTFTSFDLPEGYNLGGTLKGAGNGTEG